MDFFRRSVVNNIAYHVLPTNGDVEVSGSPLPDGVSSTTNNSANGSSSHNGESLNGDRLPHKEGYVPSVNVFPTWIWESLDLPAWMQHSEHIPKAPHKLHPTAWLDGLRGIASLCVVFHHSSVLWYLSLNNGWGSDAENRMLVQLPIVRLLYSGSAMVAVFFIVSGFSLSYKALALIRNKRHSEVLDCLSSSVFRRGMRLVIPPAVIHFFAMLATYAGFYGVGPSSRQPPRYETFGENVALWMRSVIELADPFRPSVYPGGYNPTYDTNLWTIPVEFHGSMAIFLTLIGVAKIHTPARLFVLCGLVLYLLYYAYTHMFLFIGGVLLAELGHMREAGKKERTDLQPSDPDRSNLPAPGRGTWTRVKTASWTASFIVALWVLSMPLSDFGARTSPGFMTLSTLIPPNYRQRFFEDQFWIHLAAMLLVFTLDNAKALQPLFTCRFAQWLGKISFALYILHGHFLYTIGWNLSARAFQWVGNEPGFQYGLAVFLTMAVMFPLLFWTSHVVAKHVDARSVAFARWLYVRCSKAA